MNSENNNNSVWLCIQGPTRFAEKMLEGYENYTNKVWATWESEPHLDLIKGSGCELVVLKKPGAGHRNVNLQCVSAKHALVKAKELGATHAFKVRSDLILSDLDSLTQLCMASDKLSFFCYHNHRGGYVTDFFNFGQIGAMIEWWDLTTDRRDVCPEVYIQENFYKKNDLPCDRSLKASREHFNFLIKDMRESNISASWLSRGGRDLVNCLESKCGLFLT